MSLTVGVKFCGNCNPQIDSMAVLNKLKSLLPDCRFVSHVDPKNVLLILSGCPVDCAERPSFDGPVVGVAGETLELITCPEEKLAESIAAIIQKLKQHGINL